MTDETKELVADCLTVLLLTLALPFVSTAIAAAEEVSNRRCFRRAWVLIGAALNVIYIGVLWEFFRG